MAYLPAWRISNTVPVQLLSARMTSLVVSGPAASSQKCRFRLRLSPSWFCSERRSRYLSDFRANLGNLHRLRHTHTGLLYPPRYGRYARRVNQQLRLVRRVLRSSSKRELNVLELSCPMHIPRLLKPASGSVSTLQYRVSTLDFCDT